MKKSTKVWLIVAGALVVAGIIITGCSFAAVGFQLDRLNVSPINFTPFRTHSLPFEAAKHTEYKFSGTDYESITLDEDVGSIDFVVADDGKYSVSYFDLPEYVHTVNDDGKSFKLTGRGDLNSATAFNWMFGWMNISSKSRTNSFRVVVSIPSDFSGKLDIIAKCGDIDVSGISTGKDICIVNHLGSCRLSNINAADVSLTASAGDLELDRVNGGALKVFNKLGAVSMENSSFGGSAAVSANAGDINIRWLSAAKLDVDNLMGSVKLSRATITGDAIVSVSMGELNASDFACEKLSLDCKTGEVNANNVLCGDIDIDVNAGSINCCVSGDPADYRVSAVSNMGNASVSDSGSSSGSKSLKAHTQLGDVNVTFDY